MSDSSTAMTDITVPSVGEEEAMISTHFTTLDKLFQKIESLHRDDDALQVDGMCVSVCCVCVYYGSGQLLTSFSRVGVSVDDYDAIVESTKRRQRKFRFRYYDAALKQLIITIRTFKHEALHLNTYALISADIISMGLKLKWTAVGATTWEIPNRSAAEGDSSGRPTEERPGGESWPTLVIEAGFSQSIGQLRGRMQWWFRQSQHQVKIVILVKMQGHRQTILFEKYTERPATQRPGATSTRAAATLQPNLDQSIVVTRPPGVDVLDAESYIVTRGALRLEFNLLFLREPGPGERDVVLEVEELQGIAKEAWR